MSQARPQSAFSASAATNYPVRGATAPALAPNAKPKTQTVPQPRISAREREQKFWRVVIVCGAFFFAAFGLGILYGFAQLQYETRHLAELKKQAAQNTALLRQTEMRHSLALSPMEIEKLAKQYNMIKVSDKETVTVE